MVGSKEAPNSFTIYSARVSEVQLTPGVVEATSCSQGPTGLCEGHAPGFPYTPPQTKGVDAHGQLLPTRGWEQEDKCFPIASPQPPTPDIPEMHFTKLFRRSCLVWPIK